MVRKTIITGELGANHQRDWSVVVDALRAAVNAKVDIIKFQTYSSETLYCKNTQNFGIYKNINKLIKDIELPREWQRDIKELCDGCGLEFMSTPFDERAVDELYNLGVKRFKIGGFEATDPRFVRYVAKTKLPIIISAGIGTNVAVVDEIISWISDENKIADITILHCNNAYPTPFEDINLLHIRQLREWHYGYDYENIDLHFGFSDHTLGILAPPIAVTLGAEYIEKHFTLDRKMKGPDHAFAIEPDELKQMVENIRITEKMLTHKQQGLTSSEKSFEQAMRSVVSKRAIKAGETLTKENITTKRPFPKNAIPAINFYKVLGKTITCDVDEDTPLKEYMFLDWQAQ